MRRVLIVAACVALVFFGAAADGPATKAGETTLTIQDRYVSVGAGEVAQNPDQFIGKSLQIKDRFLRAVGVGEVPSAAENFGVLPRTHVAFRTSAAGGSDLLCFAPVADREALGVLQGLVEGSAITLLGDLKGRAGGERIFAVSKMFRGHGDVPVLQKYRLVLTFRSPRTDKKFEYTFPELNKEYSIKLPDTLQELNKAYTGTGSETREPIDVKVFVKAELR